jgi:hypothetical protein
MIKWFQNRKRKKKVVELEQRLVDILTRQQPKMHDIFKNSQLQMVMILLTPTPFIQLLHSISGPYFEKHRTMHKDMYNLTGIQIKDLGSGTYVDLKLEVTWDLISKIYVEKPGDFWKRYDLENIQINNLVRTDLPVNNDDEKKLRKLLKNIEKEHLHKLDIEQCFEIELDDKKFLTILDMEDGNYIVVNTHGHVFRLFHDSENQVKMIHKSVDAFVREFSGDKKELEKHFVS